MKKFDNGDVLIGDNASYFLNYDDTNKKMSVVECIQDVESMRYVLYYLCGIICHGMKTDGMMFPAEPFYDSGMNDMFENIVDELRRKEKGDG